MPPNNPSSASSYDKSHRDELKVGTFNANSTTGTASGWGAPPPAVAGSWGEASGPAQPSRMSGGWQPQQQTQQPPPPPPPQSSFRGRGGYESRGGERSGGWGQRGGHSADSGELFWRHSRVRALYIVKLLFHRHGTLPSTYQFLEPRRRVQFERRPGRRNAGLRPLWQGRLLRRSHR